jgi:hypothetical protein
MKRVTSRSWTSEQESLLLSLVEKGASAARASAALNRPRNAVQNRARQLGKPFQDVRIVKAARLFREAGALDPLQTIAQLADSSHTQSG